MQLFIKFSFLHIIIYFLSLASISAQESIFDKDTVYFWGFQLDKNENLKVDNRRHSNINFEDSLDYISNSITTKIKIKKDKNGLVRWNLCEERGEVLFNDLQMYNNMDWDIFNGIFKKNKKQAPPFKAFISNDEIIYKDDKNSLILFKISFKDTTSFIPSFILGSDGNRFQSDNLKLVYKGEKNFNFKGKGIPCYYFESMIANYIDGLKVFNITYNDILIEKTSLLPVFSSKRAIFRTHLDKLNAEHRGSKEGYYLIYTDSEIIEAK